MGHTAVAPDLPGHGRDKTPLASVTMQAYVNRVCEVIEAQRESVILVGHSMGGGPITQAAEELPDRIKLLVYLTAVLPRNGETQAGITQQDAGSLALANFVMSDDGSFATFRESRLKEILYGDCSNEDIALARLSLTPQVIAPLVSPVHISAERFGRVPRVFIECRRDCALTPAHAKTLYTLTPCQQIISLDTSHSPFFSAPKVLARHLVQL